ncbi:hypothetical protein [Bradyrhizobium sp. JYMT SZCCT0428]|uniref:hypothetical protein n=1 Tax=Bradyrhizobium sp. JYMT SZCCT0428 TaxID=2807673 RepID=UPI001BA9127F|nr:hypothetical protein [Bradyrhizobium sp. JYMT SZCCT0428]MBR1156427.1 hypothetical protein [Bradyrhizobium sp. JYMT SZCCT0428]
MNLPAALISAGLGAAFLAAELTFYYQPAWINPDYALGLIFSMRHSKARTAVSRLLINPQSAEFSALRSVEENAAKYVCGAVKAKDKSGKNVDFRSFVYTVATDSARIDDDGLISHRHGAFRACPNPPEDKASPDGRSMVKTIEKVVPSVVSSAMSTIGTQMPSGGGSGGSLEQQVGHMANQMTGGPLPGSSSGSGSYSGSASSSGSASKSGSAGQQPKSSSNAVLDNESGWSSDRPPAAWPTFPPDHPLARSAPKRTADQAIALAKKIEDRWEQAKSGNAKARPSSDEIQEACRALLTISPKESKFPKAWAAFVRLRKIDREAA